MMSKAIDPTTFFHVRVVDKNGAICPRAGATLMYTTEPDPDNMTEKPIMVVSVCSPMDNYSKASGRKTCMSRFHCKDPHHVTQLSTLLKRDDNPEDIVRSVLADRWKKLVKKWTKRGQFPVKRTAQREISWADFELKLTRKKRRVKGGKK